MALNFSAEQFDDFYTPKYLSQWEVPKKFRKHPKNHEGYSTPLTNKNGHFLSDVKRPTFKEWSSFSGTWGKDYSRPKAVACSEIKHGMWLIKGRRARWVEAKRNESI